MFLYLCSVWYESIVSPICCPTQFVSLSLSLLSFFKCRWLSCCCKLHTQMGLSKCLCPHGISLRTLMSEERLAPLRWIGNTLIHAYAHASTCTNYNRRHAQMSTWCTPAQTHSHTTHLAEELPPKLYVLLYNINTHTHLASSITGDNHATAWSHAQVLRPQVGVCVRVRVFVLRVCLWVFCGHKAHATKVFITQTHTHAQHTGCLKPSSSMLYGLHCQKVCASNKRVGQQTCS